MSSFKPGGVDSVSTSVTKPYLYSCLTNSSIVSVRWLLLKSLKVKWLNEFVNFCSPIGADAVNGDFKSFGLETFRPSMPSDPAPADQYRTPLARIAVKVAMLLHVRAKTRRPAVDVHLPRHTALHQRVEAVVNRRHGNIGHLAFGADENFLGRRMIALLRSARHRRADVAA